VLIKDLTCDRVDEGMGNPCSVVPCSHFAKLVSADLFHGYFVGLGVIFDRDLRRHSAHSGDFPSDEFVYQYS
jgi:hypothetical protein